MLIQMVTKTSVLEKHIFQSFIKLSTKYALVVGIIRLQVHSDIYSIILMVVLHKIFNLINLWQQQVDTFPKFEQLGYH